MKLLGLKIKKKKYRARGMQKLFSAFFKSKRVKKDLITPGLTKAQTEGELHFFNPARKERTACVCRRKNCKNNQPATYLYNKKPRG